jgi:Rad3-related DNA helicase
LWAGVPQVILLSATLYPYTLSLLGIPREKYDFKAFSNGWPKQNGLVYYIPTVKLSYKSDDAAYQKIVDRMDEIISGRLDRKGIIHTGSYARMRTLMERSKYSKYMLFNERAGDSTLIANRFRAAKAPAILISPSFSTGWDFAYDSCEYQIIPKTPFPYSESRVMQERCKDESYRTYLTLTAVSQMIGRGRRAADDRCETFILDNHFPGVFAKGERFMGKAFSMHKVATVPKAPEKLRTKKDVGTT